MSEPQQDLSTEPSELSAHKDASDLQAAAVETALDKPNGLPFFDLDIALIRRRQTTRQPDLQSQGAAPAKPAATIPAPEVTREQKALDALEALLAERALLKPHGQQGAPVTLFPKTPAVVSAAAQVAAPAGPKPAEHKQIEPRLMPAPARARAQVGFVSPGFERSAPVAPVAIEAGEPLATLATALLQTAVDVTAKSADLLPELKLQMLRQALAKREARLFTAQQAVPPRHASRPATASSEAPQITAPATTGVDDMPWGHVTYRLLVM